MEERIWTFHPCGKHGVHIERTKYDVIRAEILDVVRANLLRRQGAVPQRNVIQVSPEPGAGPRNTGRIPYPKPFLLGRANRAIVCAGSRKLPVEVDLKTAGAGIGIMATRDTREKLYRCIVRLSTVAAGSPPLCWSTIGGRFLRRRSSRHARLRCSEVPKK